MKHSRALDQREPPVAYVRVMTVGLILLLVFCLVAGCIAPATAGRRGSSTAIAGGRIGPNGTPDFGPALAEIGATATAPALDRLARPTSLPGATVARSPDQPGFGPGGSDYPFRYVVWHAYGQGALAYFLFEPAGPSPPSAPVVVFVHGWMATTPTVYWSWIRHLVRKGNVVVYPVYQVLTSPPSAYTANAIGAEASALRVLRQPGHVAPLLGDVAVIGHSVGGVVAFDLTAEAAGSGLPMPKALLTVEPGALALIDQRWEGISLADARRIPSTTYYLTIVGDRDSLVGYADATRLWDAIPQIPASHRDIVKVITDRHGSPGLVADHFMPCAGAGLPFGWMTATNADDYYVTWKLSVALVDTAFFHRDVAYALGGTPEQRFMGRWSDGTPVQPLFVTEDPGRLGPDPLGTPGRL